MIQKTPRSGSSPKDLFDAFDEHDFSLDTCFLCGLRLSDKTRSNEHIFPQWLLRRFGLHDQQLNLLNGTSIPYRQLTVPCCKRCNNEHLSPIERAFQDVIEGRKPLNALDEKTIYLWATKIFYGLLFREVLLPMDRSKPHGGSIVSADEMGSYRMLHMFLQGARIKIDFQCDHASFPRTVSAFKVQEPKTPELEFDFRDDIHSQALYLRLGSVGLLASFDAGAQAFELGSLYAKYKRYALHPVQLEELGAVMFYKASLFDRVPKLIVLGDRRRGYQIIILPLAGLTMKPVFQEWDNTMFVRYLSEFTGMPLDQLASEDARRVMTFLRGPGSQRFKAININKHPYRGAP